MLQVFEHKTLRRILGIRWQDRISNETIREIVKIPYIDEWVRKRRWTWLGHTIRSPKQQIMTDAMSWSPEGARARGRPRSTWLRTLKREADTDWESVYGRAQDRGEWRDFVEVLCVRRRERW